MSGLVLPERLRDVVASAGRIANQAITLMFETGGSSAARSDSRLLRCYRDAVALNPDAALTMAELEEFLADRLARYKHPKVLEIVDALPRNPAGKVLKTELRARFAAGPSAEKEQSSSGATTSAGSS